MDTNQFHILPWLHLHILQKSQDSVSFIPFVINIKFFSTSCPYSSSLFSFFTTPQLAVDKSKIVGLNLPFQKCRPCFHMSFHLNRMFSVIKTELPNKNGNSIIRRDQSRYFRIQAGSWFFILITIDWVLLLKNFGIQWFNV